MKTTFLTLLNISICFFFPAPLLYYSFKLSFIMKKFFFFKSSSSNGTDKQIPRESSPRSEESGGQALRRSRSLSSPAFLVDVISQHPHRNHSSRCFTPERHTYEEHDSSRSMTSCSSNVSSHILDRYVDREDHLQGSKQKSNSGNLSSRSTKGKRLPPRVQCPSPLSDKPKTKATRSDLSYTDSRDASPRSLARSVIERLSLTHANSKASSYDPITIQDVYGKTLDSNSHGLANVVDGHQQFFLDVKNGTVGTNQGDANSELERKYKIAEKRVKLLSEELKEQKLFSDCEFDISSLVWDIRQMEEDRVGLAFEVLSLLRSQIVEREEIRRTKMDWDLHLRRVEKEKSELQVGLEKEIDRRSSEWTSKLENLQLEEKRLRERVRGLAEQNVSLQRQVSTFHEKETQRIDMIRNLDETVTELNATAEELREENSYLMENLSNLQESYAATTEDLDCVRRSFEEKDMECRELHKSVTKFLRTFKEQEKTIQGLRDGLCQEIKKQPSERYEEMVKKLQMEQIRLTGLEISLRKEVESVKLEANSLCRENICLLNRVKGNGEEVTTLKLDNEMKMRVSQLQDQGISMLNESTQLCCKLLKFIKEKSTQIINSGLSEQFLIESEIRVHGIQRGTETLKRSLQTVTGLLLEKSNEMASNPESSSSSACNNHSVQKSLREELRAETLLTSLLREKLFSKEEEIEQLQAEVAAGVRGNEVLHNEIRNTLDNLSINNHQLKDLKLQVVKKDENINRLENNLQEAAKDLASMKVTLAKVLEERGHIWKDVKECRERNVDLKSEKEIMKKKIEKLEEDLLFKEGQITILKDTLGSKHFSLLSSPDFSYDDFLVQ